MKRNFYRREEGFTNIIIYEPEGEKKGSQRTNDILRFRAGLNPEMRISSSVIVLQCIFVSDCVIKDFQKKYTEKRLHFSKFPFRD